MGSINILTPILMTFVELLPENSLIMLNNRVKFFAHFELYHIFILLFALYLGEWNDNI